LPLVWLAVGLVIIATRLSAVTEPTDAV
jgi:hypothetical protein